MIAQTWAPPGRIARLAWTLSTVHGRSREAYVPLMNAPKLVDTGQRVGRCPEVTTIVRQPTGDRPGLDPLAARYPLGGSCFSDQVVDEVAE